MLDIATFVLGPVMTNVYLVADRESQQAVVIDPAWDGEVIVEAARKRGWEISAIWITHAHFDHIAGAAAIIKSSLGAPTRSKSPFPVALHASDLPLWNAQGGAPYFGLRIDPVPAPTLMLTHATPLTIGSTRFEVRHCPGHTPGHVIFYCAQEKVVFCGDVIFEGSIGRTDLPGGDFNTLIHSIRSQILTLPDDTRLFSGHGSPTTVGKERLENPFVL